MDKLLILKIKIVSQFMAGYFYCMTGMPVFCGESPHRRSYQRTL